MTFQEHSQIITFYSYKGGTGRTMALANIACLLAQNKEKSCKILMIDWDLEAPGLHRYFPQLQHQEVQELSGIKDNENDYGLIDLFSHLVSKSQKRSELKDIEKIFDEDIRLQDYVISTKIKNLHLLKAGNINSSQYASQINKFNWQRLLQKTPWVLESFKQRLLTEYDFILIDSRTGLSDTSGICTMLMPDTLVCVFTPNYQSVAGMMKVVRDATEFRRKSADFRSFIVYPLASRIEMSEEELKDSWRFGSEDLGLEGYQAQFERLFEEVYELQDCSLTQYFDETQIPHRSRYAYGEDIAVLEERDTGILSLTQSYRRIVDWLLISDGPWAKFAQYNKSSQLEPKDIPLDNVPAPGPLPSGSRIPFVANPFFAGREESLKQIAIAFRTGDRINNRVIGLTGLGGIGKTQLASEFAHRYGRYFLGGVFWINFSNPEDIPSEIAACGDPERLNLPNFNSLSLDEQVIQVQALWSQDVPRLLIFDNCQEEELLQQWQPKKGGCYILVTSRRQEWSRSLGVRSLSLSTLTRKDSIDFLRRFLEEISIDEAEAIAAELGDLPLALHLAGSFLRRYRHVITPSNFLTEIRQKTLLDHPALTSSNIDQSPTNYMQSIGLIFARSWDQLNPNDKIDAAAIHLLQQASYLASGQPIPYGLLRLTSEGHHILEDNELEYDAYLTADGINRLLTLGLLSEGEKQSLVLHRLVAAFVQSVGQDEEAQVAIEKTLLAALNKRIDQTGFLGSPQLATHLRYVTDQALARKDKQTAKLCNLLGFYFKEIAVYQTARSYYEHALAIREKVLGEEHPDTASSLNDLGDLLRIMGYLAEARPYFERALAIREKVLGKEHPDTASSLNNLGILLQDTGNLADARLYYERALTIREKALEINHPDTAQSLDNLGTLMQDMGQMEEARSYYELALVIRDKVLGPEHPETARSLNNLGTLLQAMGQLTAARPYYERALAINEKVLGAEHPDTALSLVNLGALLYSISDYEAARPYYERALAIREKVLGAEHPDTARSLNNLGGLFDATGDYEAARPYYERALAINEKVLGAEHPDTATSLYNLGFLLHATGEQESAKSYYKRALIIFEKVFGVEHPNTKIVRQHLNSVS